MDNVCHTLVGAAFARAGFTHPTRFAAATSMIAANLPDLDVLVFATGVPSVAFRRGWTHGILAQAALPALLAGVMLLIGRWSPRRAAGVNVPAPSLGPLMLLSYMGVLSHVFLDYLNTYGVRLLMPFSGRWFYGDALFIVDPWLWVVFAAAVVLGRGGRSRYTRMCLIVAGGYIVCMVGSARAARSIVLETWNRTHATPPRALMVGPAPIDPLRKAIIVDADDRYRTGTFTWLPPTTVFRDTVLKNDDQPAVARARRDPRIAGVLVWARFPFWEIAATPEGTRVTVRDMRFPRIGRGGFSATTIVTAPYRSFNARGAPPRSHSLGGGATRRFPPAPRSGRRRFILLPSCPPHVPTGCHPTSSGSARARRTCRRGPVARRRPDPAASRARRQDTGSTVPRLLRGSCPAYSSAMNGYL